MTNKLVFRASISIFKVSISFSALESLSEVEMWRYEQFSLNLHFPNCKKNLQGRGCLEAQSSNRQGMLLQIFLTWNLLQVLPNLQCPKRLNLQWCSTDIFSFSDFFSSEICLISNTYTGMLLDLLSLRWFNSYNRIYWLPLFQT